MVCLLRKQIFSTIKRNIATFSITRIQYPVLSNRVNKRYYSSFIRSKSRSRNQTISTRAINANNITTEEIEKHDLTFLDQIFASNWNKSQQNILYDVLLLNAPSDALVRKVCHHSNTIVCADGGANSLFDSQNDCDVIPNAIVGDLDSVNENVLNYFVNKGTKKILIEDQNDNDFNKALMYLLDMQTASNYIICWGAFGDRFDHEMQGLNILYKFKMHYDSLHPTKKMILMTGNNFAMVLGPGKHQIKCAEIQGPVCSVLPLYSKVVVSTKGLQYDMDGQLLQFGGMISSSNGFNNKQNVEIETDELVLFHTSCFIQSK